MKLTLFSIKHHNMQVHGRSGSIAPGILYFGTRYGVISFMLRSLYPRGKNLR